MGGKRRVVPCPQRCGLDDRHERVRLEREQGAVDPAPAPARTVVMQQWDESERGWGERPDGYTLHRDRAAHRAFCSAFYEKRRAYYEKEFGPGVTPTEYTRVSGPPTLITVTDELYQCIASSDANGIWGESNTVDVDLGGCAILGAYKPWPR